MPNNADSEAKTPIETNSDLIAEVQSLVDNLPEAGGGSGTSADGWTKIGELTMGGTVFPITAYADGIITVTPQDGVYPTVGRNTIIRKKDYTDPVPLRLVATGTDGQYTMTNLGGGTYAPTNIDLTQYVVEMPEATSLQFSDIPAFSYYKVRYTSPTFVTYGSRDSYKSSYSALNLNAEYRYHAGGSFEAVQETAFCPISGRIYVKTTIHGHQYGQTLAHSMFLMVNEPAVPTSMTFYHYNQLLTIDTRIELWGRN